VSYDAFREGFYKSSGGGTGWQGLLRDAADRASIRDLLLQQLSASTTLASQTIAAAQVRRPTASRLGTARQETMPLNDGRIPNPAVVRVAPGTGYNRAEGFQRASRNGPVSDLPPEIPKVTIRHLFIAVTCVCVCVCAQQAELPQEEEEQSGLSAAGSPSRPSTACTGEGCAVWAIIIEDCKFITWVLPLPVLPSGDLGHRGVRGAAGLGYRFHCLSGPCHLPPVGGWFGFIVDSRGSCKSKAKVL
jgi:hypothetical protein